MLFLKLKFSYVLNVISNEQVRVVARFGLDGMFRQNNLALRSGHIRTVPRLQRERDKQNEQNARQHKTWIRTKYEGAKGNGDFACEDHEHPVCLAGFVVVVPGDEWWEG
jgi:hypothetical protein